MGSTFIKPQAFPKRAKSAVAAAVTLLAVAGATAAWQFTKETPNGESASRNIICWTTSSGSGICFREDGSINASGSLLSNGVQEHWGSAEITGTGSATATGTSVYSWSPPFAGTITDADAFLSETADDNLTTMDIKIDGASIFSTLLTIDATETGSFLAATPKVINTAANRFERYSRVTIDTYAPATTPGKNLTANIKFKQETFP